MALFLSIFFVVQAFSSIFAADYLINGMKNSLLYTLLMVLLACVATTSQAEDITTYYANADGKKKVELKLALKDIISNHKKLGYSSLWNYYEKVDYIEGSMNSAGNYRVSDYYSDEVAYFPEPSSMNKEHTVPQSWWGGGTGVPQGNDIFQVLPSSKTANSAKGNYPLGVVVGSVSYPKAGTNNTRMKTGHDANGNMVFEPCDEYKGDFARIYMYVATCYSDVSWKSYSSNIPCTLKKEDWPTFYSQDFIYMLLKWCREDPVSEWERTRNERAYAQQGNRNPFIDYPSLHEFIWGDSIDYVFDISLPHGQQDYDPSDKPDDPDNPGNPDDPDNPETPDNPDAQSGTIEFSKCNWMNTSHSTYGNGFTATVNGLVVSYYTYNSQNQVIKANPEIRLYKGAVLLIEGAQITKVVLHAADSKLADVSIDGQTYVWQNASTISWEGDMNPFILLAQDGQSRISSIDVTIVPSIPTGVGSIRSTPPCRLVFDAGGRCVGPTVPLRRGVYVVREGEKTSKIIVK